MAFRVYKAASGEALVLPPPRLASWIQSDHPDQVALEEYLAALEPLVRPLLDQHATGLALELTVGLPERIALISGGRDLDNFLSPVVDRLGRERFVSVRGRKVRGESSSLRISVAERAGERDLDGWSFREATAASSSGIKAAIGSVLSAEAAAPLGPLELELAFVIGEVAPSLARNWVTLWKPSIDALGHVLGDDPRRPFHPNDDRIVSLGLHRSIEPALRFAMRIGVWWRSVGADSP